jgi:hypothetical protein
MPVSGNEQKKDTDKKENSDNNGNSDNKKDWHPET